jgi:CBS domain-containing protein
VNYPASPRWRPPQIVDSEKRSGAMKASDVMTRNVVTIKRGASILEAIQLMLENRVSGLPVLGDEGKVVGILTEGDLLHRSETATERHRPRWLELLMGPGRIAEEYVKTHGRKVEEIMTHDLVSVTEDTALDEIVQLMERRRIKRVPVLKGDLLAGVVSRADLLRALARTLDERPGGTHSDAEIRERILSELEKAAWVPRDGLSITVSDGVVDLNGVILEEKEREALRVVAENTPGVKAVEDHLVWIEPVSGLVIEPSTEESPPASTASR